MLREEVLSRSTDLIRREGKMGVQGNERMPRWVDSSLYWTRPPYHAGFQWVNITWNEACIYNLTENLSSKYYVFSTTLAESGCLCRPARIRILWDNISTNCNFSTHLWSAIEFLVRQYCLVILSCNVSFTPSLKQRDWAQNCEKRIGLYPEDYPHQGVGSGAIPSSRTCLSRRLYALPNKVILWVRGFCCFSLRYIIGFLSTK